MCREHWAGSSRISAFVALQKSDDRYDDDRDARNESSRHQRDGKHTSAAPKGMEEKQEPKDKGAQTGEGDQFQRYGLFEHVSARCRIACRYL